MPTRRETGIHAEGVNQLLRTLGTMGKEVSDYARDESVDLADTFLGLVRRAATGAAESAVAEAFKVYRDRVPKVGFTAGKRAPISGAPRVGEVFYGYEFGGRSRPTTRQFPAFDRGGNFLYPTLRDDGEDLAEDWFDRVFRSLDKDWERGARSV